MKKRNQKAPKEPYRVIYYKVPKTTGVGQIITYSKKEYDKAKRDLDKQKLKITKEY